MRPKLSRSDRSWVRYMLRALELAELAEKLGEVPVGALVLDMDGRIISEAFNQRESQKDPTAHAEILALREAAQKLSSWRLTSCTLVVTLEPCVMCAGASSLSRIDRVVFGASDLRAGGMGSLYSVHQDSHLNHRIEVISGVLANQCSEKLLNFFRSKR